MTVPRKAEVVRMVAAAREAGLTIGGVEIAPDGTIRVLSEKAVAVPVAANAYDRWKAEQG